jgi:hypothetical protein
MPRETVTIFKPYSFRKGQKIRIVGGKRKGDWEVVGMTDRTVKLRCPISERIFEWHRFCYMTEERENEPWPLDND